MSLRFPGALALLLGVLALPAPGAEDGKDAYGDPLPKGAKARLGTARMRLLEGYSSPVLTPDGKSILSMSSGKLTRFDVTTGLATETLPGAKVGGTLAPNVVSADGKRGAGFSYDSVTVVELGTGKKLAEVKRRLYSGDSLVSLSADGKTLAVGGVVDDKAKDKGVTVQLWNVDDDKEIAAIKVAQNNTGRVALSADGKVLATWGAHYEMLKPGVELDPETDAARLVQLWDAITGKPISTAKFGTAVSAVSIAPDGHTVAVSDGVGSIKLFSAKTGEFRKQLLGRSRLGRMIQFSGDGKALAAAADDGAIQLWNLETGRSVGVAESPVGSEYLSLRAMAFPTAERLVALAFRGASAVVWEAPSGKRLSPVGGHTETPGGLSFTNGDKEVLGLATAGQVIRWDLAGKELGTVKFRIPGAPAASYPLTERVQAVPNLPLAIRPESSGIGIYDLPSGLQKFSIPSENAYISNLGFAKDGSKVAVVIPPAYSVKPKPGRVAVVDVAKSELAGGFALPAGIIIAAASTADGGKLAVVRRTPAAGKEPQKLFLNAYETAGGKSVCELPLEENFGSFYLAQSPAKDRVILVDPKDGVVEIDLAEGKKVRNLTKGYIGLTIAPVLSDDGKFIAHSIGSTYGAEPSTIEVREVESGKLVHKFTGHSRPATALAFSKDGKMLASASSDTTILLWDLTSSEKE